ncbi:helix-turn-helix domain-containing protein [Mesorhizobium sp. M1060]|nr:hypothetical protein [Mesorhizobium sp. C089B]WJI51893.1 helix-turn-helix domain-containing protein [Mesorhizobium sp. C089B]
MKPFPPIPLAPRRSSPRMSDEMAAKAKALLGLGYSQQDIATMLGVNQGRVSEINTGERFGSVPPAQLELPL